MIRGVGHIDGGISQRQLSNQVLVGQLVRGIITTKSIERHLFINDIWAANLFRDVLITTQFTNRLSLGRGLDGDAPLLINNLVGESLG